MNPSKFLSLAGVAYCLIVPAAYAGTFKHIVIDGEFADWAGVPVAYSDPSEEGASAGTDFKTVWMAHDADYLYVRVSFYNSGSLLRSQNNVFLNGDGDVATGFAIHGTGSEMLIQAGSGYQEKNGTFNDGSLIQDLGWAAAPTGETNEFEFRISRKAKFEDGGLVVTSDSIGLLLETENSNYAEVDVAKDDGPIEYTLTAPPPPAKGTVELLSLTGANWRLNRSGTDPGSGWQEPTFDDTQPGWESGHALFGKTGNPAAYPVPIATPFSDNQTTYYFRARFNWDKDTAGVSLVASNWLSDGAIIYLNGAVIARVRLPDGPIASSTPASGPNPNPGQAEIIDLPANALVVGDNVLAVEVHQSLGDTNDLVFGLSLLASDQLPVAIVAPAVAQDRTVDEGGAATLTVSVRGTEPITYQWFKDALAIPNATNATYTIESVTPQDAGEYLVKASNAFATNVASAVTTLKTQAVPVTIADSKLPADVRVTAGEAARFTIDVTGSQPISFRWFKNGVGISDATNQVYEIPAVLPSDAGNYAVVVSNRITAPLTSRTAKLSVDPDRVPPLLLSASGGGRRVVLQFSEPLDTASLAPGSFTLNPAVSVTAAQLSPEDEAAVILEVGALKLGTLYSVNVSGVKDRFGNAVSAGTTKSFRATILIDGDFSDWEGVPIASSDPQDAGPDTGAHADFKDVWVASDNDYLYLRFTLWQEGDPFIFFNNIFVDTDNDPATGYAFDGLGSDLLVQGGGGYEQKAGTFNDGTVDDLGWLAAPAAPGTDFEMRISRQARYADADAGGLVFRSPTIAVALESENTGFATKEMAPDAGAELIVHTLQNYEVTELGALTASRSGQGIRITWTGPGKLQSSDSLSPSRWQDVPNAASPFTSDASNRQTYYRLAR